MSWFQEAKQITAREVADALGLNVRRKLGVTGFTCPVHNEDHRDGRPSGRLVHNGAGWKCWNMGCGASGDGLSLAAAVLTGSTKPQTWQVVREWYRSRGWVNGETSSAPVEVVIEAPKPRPVERLPLEEVRALWDLGWPPFTEERSRRWFQARGLSDWQCGSIVRALPLGVAVPRWATCNGRAWSEGHALMLPTYDAAGALVGVRARWVGTEWDGEAWTELEAPGGRKEVNPRGSGVLRGTVYADEVGRSVLEGSPLPSWSRKVVIVEGGPAWLRYAIEAATASERPAVLGVWSGAWPDDEEGDRLAARLSAAVGVYVATDNDEAGDRYASRIGATLARASITAKRIKGGE